MTNEIRDYLVAKTGGKLVIEVIMPPENPPTTYKESLGRAVTICEIFGGRWPHQD